MPRARALEPPGTAGEQESGYKASRLFLQALASTALGGIGAGCSEVGSSGIGRTGPGLTDPGFFRVGDFPFLVRVSDSICNPFTDRKQDPQE